MGIKTIKNYEELPYQHELMNHAFFLENKRNDDEFSKKKKKVPICRFERRRNLRYVFS